MKKRFGLLGEKLGHSFSPLIHGYLGDYEYNLYEVSPSDLDTFMTKRDFDGINVTIPYKQAVIPYCAYLSDEAANIGSVNTIIKDDNGLLHGYNTDHYGFCVMLEKGYIRSARKKALVLGDGGSARTVRTALADLGAREIVTISRRGENNYNNIEHHYDADIIVNTTPVGMYPGNGSCALSLTGFTYLSGVADLIYNPSRTKLLLEAERLDIPCIGGLTMLVSQAEMASRLFTCGSARPELVKKITDEILRKTLNIALIGMPGCGKTTVGRMLAEKTHRVFADIDELIEVAAGKSIPRIFAEDGEEAFRGLETRILSDETKKSGLVIATGGGVVTRPENLDLLRQNSLVIYLERDLSELIAEGRPLSIKDGVKKLADERLNLYKSWSDYTVPVQANPDLTSGKIMEVLML